MNKNQIVGRAIALSAAIFYGFNTTLSRLAYDTGTTPMSLIFYRFAMSAFLLIVLVLILKKNWKLEVTPMVFASCVLGMFAVSIGHLGAVNYVPVSLAAIIFYTFPLLVVAHKRLVYRQAISYHEGLAFLLAFAGIGIALGPDFHEFDPIGIALASLGAIGATVFIISYERFPDNTDSYVSTTWIMSASVLFTILALQFGFELVPPEQSVGWVYLGMMTVVTVISLILSLTAISRIGATLFALLLNFEPVVILLLAWIVIGEELTLERIAGISLVIFALFLSHWKKPGMDNQVTEAP